MVLNNADVFVFLIRADGLVRLLSGLWELSQNIVDRIGSLPGHSASVLEVN